MDFCSTEYNETYLCLYTYTHTWHWCLFKSSYPLSCLSCLTFDSVLKIIICQQIYRYPFYYRYIVKWGTCTPNILTRPWFWQVVMFHGSSNGTYSTLSSLARSRVCGYISQETNGLPKPPLPFHLEVLLDFMQEKRLIGVCFICISRLAKARGGGVGWGDTRLTAGNRWLKAGLIFSCDIKYLLENY